MSLWTPSGEHPVDRDHGRGDPSPRPRAVRPEQHAEEPTPEEVAALEAELAEVRRRLEEVPAGVVVAQYALQLYELAAVHLSRTPPALDEAIVAIDALAAVVERVGHRMAEGEAPVREALRQVQLAFVELSRRQDEPGSSARPG